MHLFNWRNTDYIFVVQFLRMMVKSDNEKQIVLNRGYNEQKMEVKLGTKPLRNSREVTV